MDSVCIENKPYKLIKKKISKEQFKLTGDTVSSKIERSRIVACFCELLKFAGGCNSKTHFAIQNFKLKSEQT